MTVGHVMKHVQGWSLDSSGVLFTVQPVVGI